VLENGFLLTTRNGTVSIQLNDHRKRHVEDLKMVVEQQFDPDEILACWKWAKQILRVQGEGTTASSD
jgi:hypothetical protein